MNTLNVFLGRIVDALNAARVPFMVAGSLASTYHSRPRTTQDADIVIQAGLPDVRRLLGALPNDQFYVSEEAAVDAVARGGQFNVIDMQTAWKADLVICKRRPFSEEEFRRRVPVALLGVAVNVATAEDTLLARFPQEVSQGLMCSWDKT